MSKDFGFIYVWYDILNKMYYIGSHWGYPDDGYICSSRWMLNNYKKRPQDFKRKIVKKIYTNRTDLLIEEQKWIDMIDPLKTVINNKNNEKREKNVKYYNINLNINKNLIIECAKSADTVESFYNELLNKISNAAGKFWDLAVIEDDQDSGFLRIVEDRKSTRLNSSH